MLIVRRWCSRLEAAQSAGLLRSAVRREHAPRHPDELSRGIGGAVATRVDVDEGRKGAALEQQEVVADRIGLALAANLAGDDPFGAPLRV